MLKPFSLLAAILLLSTAALAQPTTGPASPDFAQTPMRVQTLRGSDHFLYGETEATTADLPQAIRSLTQPLTAAREAGKLQVSGQLIITMTGTPGDRSSPMKIRAGYSARPGTIAPEGYTIGKLEAQRAATTVFSGPVPSIREAFVQLYTELGAAGLEPTGEMRQMFAYYEGPESENNVFILQVLVK